MPAVIQTCPCTLVLVLWHRVVKLTLEYGVEFENNHPIGKEDEFEPVCTPHGPNMSRSNPSLKMTEHLTRNLVIQDEKRCPRDIKLL